MSKQSELDDMPDLSDTHTLVDVPGFGKVWAVNNIHGYYNTWLDWHNKQVIEKLEELEYHDMSLKGNKAILKQINKLKEQSNA